MAKRSKKKATGPSPRPKEKKDSPATNLVPDDPKLLLAQALLIVIAGAWVAAPALFGGWIRDDLFYINQALMTEPGRLWKIWFQPGSFIEYYPLTETVQWLQWRLFGDETFGYHLTNIVLHLVNSLLVWQLLRKFGLSFAWLGGLIFAVHPAQVESVAWISELKNTLSLAPFLLAMMAWIDYDDRRENRDYFLALGLFLVAMLCKITMAPFPVVILLYAWWKRGRVRWNDFTACFPFLIVSLVLGFMNVESGAAYAHQQMFSSIATPQNDFLPRAALTGTSLAFYFSKFFWPGTVLPMYPRWFIEPLTFFEFLPWPVLAGVLYFLWTKRKTWGRHVLLGGGFFLLNILPFLGFTTVSFMRFTWVMDHFLYIPFIGLIGLVVAAVGDVRARIPFNSRPLVSAAMTIVVTLLAFEGHAYSGAYANEVTLWKYTLEYNPGSWGAQGGLADALTRAGKYDEAIRQYQSLLTLMSNDPEIYNNLAEAYLHEGRFPEAWGALEQAIDLKPDYAKAHGNLGYVMEKMGRIDEAVKQLETVVKLQPDNAPAQKYLDHLKALQAGTP